MIMHVMNGLPVKYIFKPLFTVTQNDNLYTVDVFHSAVFSNYIKLKRSLDQLPRKQTIVIDFSETKMVDHTVMENLKHYQNEYQNEGGNFELRGLGKYD
jgi:MFS superfamily sulfate permease-like transporter